MQNNQSFSLETRAFILKRDKKKCVNCGAKATSIHHLIHNTVMNRRIYGNDKIQSAENGVCVCQQCHERYPLWDKPYVEALKIKWEQNNSKIKKGELMIKKVIILLAFIGSIAYGQQLTLPLTGAPLKITLSSVAKSSWIYSRGAKVISIQVKSDGGDVLSFICKGSLNGKDFYTVGLGNKSTGLIDDTISISDTTNIGYELVTSDEEYLLFDCISRTSGSVDIWIRGK